MAAFRLEVLSGAPFSPFYPAAQAVLRQVLLAPGLPTATPAITGTAATATAAAAPVSAASAASAAISLPVPTPPTTTPASSPTATAATSLGTAPSAVADARQRAALETVRRSRVGRDSLWLPAVELLLYGALQDALQHKEHAPIGAAATDGAAARLATSMEESGGLSLRDGIQGMNERDG